METDGGGWTLVQRTVYDEAETQTLRTTYSSFRNVPVGSPEPGKAFRVPAKHWYYLYQKEEAGLDNLFRFVLRDEESEFCTDATPESDSTVASCSPLFFGTNGTRFLFPEVAPQTAVVERGVGFWNSADPDEVSFLFNDRAGQTGVFANDLSTGSISCDSAAVNYIIPWQYTRCCLNCPTYPRWASSLYSHPMVIDNVFENPDIFGHSVDDVCVSGGCFWTTNPYYGLHVWEYYIR
eukprot:GCRY01003206.1.p1 GENE.GCRY01003206.1~~GCRY01003206.1.p1  ORF type:complete len:236 (+),score=34.92 GCRY01003206.1:389-1096(+)